MIRGFKYVSLIALLLFTTTLLTGCWDNVELQERAIVLGVGFDKVAEGAMQVSVEFPKFASGSETSQIESVRSIETGTSIFQAIRNFVLHLGKKLFWGNVGVIVIGEQFAKDGVFPLVDFYSRDQELRLSPFLLVAKGVSAADIVAGVQAETNPLSSRQMLSAMENQSATGMIRAKKMRDFLQQLNAEGIHPSIGIIEQAGGSKSFTIKGAAIFYNDRLAGWLNHLEARGLNWLTGDVNGGLLTVDYHGKKEAMTLEIFRSATEQSAEVTTEGVVFKPSIKVVVNVAELNQPVDLTSKEHTEDIKKSVTEEIKKEMNLALQTLQDLQVDAVGIGAYFNANQPAYWQQVKQDWDKEIFPKVSLMPEIKVTVRRNNFALTHVEAK